MRLELGRHVQRESFERELHDLRHRIAARRQNVVLGHLDDQTAARAGS